MSGKDNTNKDCTMPSGPSAWALIGIGRSYWWRRGNRRGGATNRDNFAVLHIEFAQKIISCYVPELAPGKGRVYHSKRVVSIGGDDVIPPRGCRASEETTRGTRIVHGVENVQPGHTCRT